MPNNKHLNKAKKEKNDEFFTQYEDIEKECQYYIENFKDKYIYLPCDDEKSNFWKYFVDNFHNFKLKHLTATHIDFNTNSYRLDYNGTETIKTALEGNGDFRSEECTKIKNESDMIITNEPFSLFRDFVYWLFGGVFEKVDNKYIRKVENRRFDYDKKFLIMSNNNAITYKEFFPFFKEKKVWLGRTLFTGKMPYFKVSDDYPMDNERFIKKEDGFYKQVNAICWFTNIPNDSNRESLCMFKKYTPEEYPQYDNYNAIECGRMENLPYNYNGIIGIPITGLKYLWSDGTIHTEDNNGEPTQFEIVGDACNGSDHEWDLFKPMINGKQKYPRILIKKRDNQ